MTVILTVKLTRLGGYYQKLRVNYLVQLFKIYGRFYLMGVCVPSTYTWSVLDYYFSLVYLFWM